MSAAGCNGFEKSSKPRARRTPSHVLRAGTCSLSSPVRGPAAIILIAACASAGLALAQNTGSNYTVTAATIDAGGNHSSAGAYAIDSSVAQPVAGADTAGGPYSLAAGFQQLPGDTVFDNGFE